MTIPGASIPNDDWDLNEARRIVLGLLEPYCADVYLFGSRANQTSIRYSDIDIAVLANKPLPAGLLAEIREALDDSNIIYRVDQRLPS